MKKQKPKTAKQYENELRDMIRARKGTDCEAWLIPQLRATAYNMVMLDKIQEELVNEEFLMKPVVGSTGQPKNEAHPLLPHYDKLQRTLLQQFEALGLNYRSTPSKLKENVKSGGEEHDKLSNVLKDILEV